MDMTVKAFSSPLLRGAHCYLISVKKEQSRSDDYVVEIGELPEVTRQIFAHYWPESYLKHCCWLVVFYTHDALFSLQPGARYQPERRMAFSLSELQHFLVEGVGQAMEHFLQQQPAASLIAMPIRPGLGRIYDRLLRRYAGKKGFIYHRTWLQEAIYVVEKK